MSKLSHTDETGKANMVDVGHKPNQLRIAKAQGFIALQPETVKLVQENNMKKGVGIMQDVVKEAILEIEKASKNTDVCSDGK